MQTFQRPRRHLGLHKNIEMCESAVRNLTASLLAGSHCAVIRWGIVEAAKHRASVSMLRRPRRTALRRVYIEPISQIRLSLRS